MRYLALGLIFVASTAAAQPVRFIGGGIADTNYTSVGDTTSSTRYLSGGSVTFEGEYADDITVPLVHPTWNFDISTDGQSVTIHEMTISYSGTLNINPLVWLELNIEAKILDRNVDINPTTTTVWTVQAHSFSSMSVSGVYHGIGLTQAYSGMLPDTTVGTPEIGMLDFNNWPTELTWQASNSSRSINGQSVPLSNESRIFSSSSANGWIGVEPYLHIREVRVWEPISVLLTPFVETADFDADGDVDGRDLLIWQRHCGMSSALIEHGDANWDGLVDSADLGIWQTQYGEPASPIFATIPEPAALLMSIIGITCVLCRFRPNIFYRLSKPGFPR